MPARSPSCYTIYQGAMKVFETELCADCVECDASSGKIAVGTYQLHEDGSKTGRLYLFQDSLDNGLGKIDVDAILDAKWYNNRCILATNSRGLATVDPDTLSVTYSDDQLDEVYLSVDISQGSVYSSGSKGNIHIARDLHRTTFKAHELEVWSVCVGNKVIYSGADDSLFKGWDMDTLECVFTIKSHGAGICSIATSPSDGNMIATGSYDKGLRLWDARMMTRPLQSLVVKGGVWRIKWIDSDRILAGCMHDGFYVFDAHSLSIIDHRNFGSLAYGCAFTGDSCFTCTFYNKQAQEWTIRKG